MPRQKGKRAPGSDGVEGTVGEWKLAKEREERRWGGVGWAGDVEGKKSLSQQKFSLKF